MTKTCGICGNKISWYKLKFKDGAICEKCLIKYKFGTKWKIKSTAMIAWCKDHSIETIKELINEGKNANDINTSDYTLKNQFKEIDKKQASLQENNASFNLSDELAKDTVDKINKLDLPTEFKQALITAKIFDIFAVKKELVFLPQIINLNNEKIIYACSGSLNGHTWLIVCTNQKIIFVNKNLLYGMQEKDIPLNAINAINYTQGAVLGSLSITNGANNFIIENVNKMAARIMAKKIQETQLNVLKVKSTNSSNTNYDELRKLKSLLDDGIITEDEFTAKKKQILNI